MTLFTGSGTALSTPFDKTGKFNQDAYERLINFQIENQTDAIITCGSTGEASTLEDDEHIEVVRAAVAFTKKACEGGRKIPVIAGSGGNNTQHCINLGRELVKAGADGLMFVVPYYNKSTQKGLVTHYKTLAAALPLPIVLYNVPSRTAMNMLPSTVEELSKVENIAAIKEASGDIAQIAEVIARCGDALDVYAGNDDYIVPVMSLGGKGVISTVANIAPAQVRELTQKYMSGDIKGAAAMQLGILKLVKALFSEVNPIPVKAALNVMGFDMGECRLPLTTMDEKLFEQLKIQMKEYGLIC